MDFLKNLSLDDKPKPHSQHEDPPPQESDHGGSMINKITDALEGGTYHRERAQTQTYQTHTSGGEESLMDKINEAVGGHHQKPVQPVPHKVEGGLLDKISGALEGHQKPVHIHEEEEGLMGKISGVIGGNQKPVHAEQTHSGGGGLLDKISGAIEGHQKPAETQKDEGGLLNKISGVVGGHQKPQEGGGIMGHINNALGGGQAGEKKEGKQKPFYLRFPRSDVSSVFRRS
jgi:hypothetical protein